MFTTLVLFLDTTKIFLRKWVFLKTISALAKSLISLTFIFSFNFSLAQVLVVTDIDDTIKNTHVLDRSEAVYNSFHINNSFKGLPEVYQAIKLAHPESQFAYVSNAIKIISQELHEDFVAKNNYPEGSVILRTNLTDKNHKIRTISKLIENIQPQFLILLGDNGERDIPIYQDVIKKFPQIKTITYIHTTYNSKSQDREEKGQALLANQIPYVTSLDLASHMAAMNIISVSHMLELSQRYSSEMLSERAGKRGSVFIPSWALCPDFYHFYSYKKNQNYIHPALKNVFAFLAKRCHP